MKKPKPDPDLDELTAELRADTKRKRHEWQMLASYLAGEPVKAIAERWGLTSALLGIAVQAALHARLLQDAAGRRPRAEVVLERIAAVDCVPDDPAADAEERCTNCTGKLPAPVFGDAQ